MNGQPVKRSNSAAVKQRSSLPTIVGITGGIGSGKSTIARELAKRGYAVYDCDREAKRIIAENKEVQAQIITLLGEEAFIKGQRNKGQRTKLVYNTTYVSQKVFAAPALLSRLNAIVHPAVKADIVNRSARCRSEEQSVCSQTESVLFVESAILYEVGLDTLCDRIIVVDAPENIRIARTITRDYEGETTPDNINKVRARIQAQRESYMVYSVQKERLLLLLNDGSKPVSELVDHLIQSLAL